MSLSLSVHVTAFYFLLATDQSKAETQTMRCAQYNHTPPNASINNAVDNGHIDHFYLYLIGYTVSMLVVTGCIGNVLTIVLFNRRNLWARVNYYLIALAAWDIALLCSAWLAFSLPTFIFYGRYGYFGSWIVSTYPFSYVVCNMTMVGCVWITVTLTVDRFMAVCYPLRHRTINSSTNAKVKVCVVSVFAIVYGLPRAAELNLKDCLNEFNATVTMVHQNDDFTSDSTFFIVYRVIGGLMFNSVGPFVVLLILTCCMLRILSRASAQRQVIGRSSRACANDASTNQRTKRLHKTKNNSDRVNRLLMLVLAKFFLCYTLPTVIDILQKFSAPGTASALNSALFYLVEISNALVVFHSTTNFFVYVCFGSKVKEEFCILIGCVPSFDHQRRYQDEASRLLSSRCVPSRKSTLDNSALEEIRLTRCELEGLAGHDV